MTSSFKSTYYLQHFVVRKPLSLLLSQNKRTSKEYKTLGKNIVLEDEGKIKDSDLNHI
jgi:hypothetical protein